MPLQLPEARKFRERKINVKALWPECLDVNTYLKMDCPVSVKTGIYRQMQDLDDLTLRRDSEAAFAKLVARRMNLVYPAALRTAPGFHIAHQFDSRLKTSASRRDFWWPCASTPPVETLVITHIFLGLDSIC